MKIFFFLAHLKNFANTTQRAFLTGFQFSLLDLYLKIVIIYTWKLLLFVIILCSAVIFHFLTAFLLSNAYQ